MWFVRVLFWAMALLSLACGDADLSSPVPWSDCRGDGVGCTDGFRCQLNDNQRYECLPDPAQADAAPAPDAMADAVIIDATAVDATVVDAAAAPRCDDGVTNGDETDVDCGGGCEPCADERVCATGTDCQSGVCTNTICAAADCDDDVQNGAERGVDCGGECPGCADGAPCADAADCQSGVCTDDLCVQASCDDGVHNGTETDVDCGGECPPCVADLACVRAADCESGVCMDQLCMAPTCEDGVRNGDEADVDCGGDCAACVPGLECRDAADCDSGVCAEGVCVEPACEDGVRNGIETDIDCGGDCLPCPVDLACAIAADCQTGVCGDGMCRGATCADGVQNGDETAVDCGGSCAGCDPGLACSQDPDCQSGVCVVERCAAPSCEDGVRNGAETDVDCGGPCDPCADAAGCGVAADCQSGVCADERCAAPSCEDGVHNGAETDVDCGGPCDACADAAGCAAPADCRSGVCTEAVCQAPRCGDGVTNGDEDCDDANQVDTDACTNACTDARCGDGIVHDELERCDDGNDVDTDECRNNCATARCGDGVIQAGVEECDDANDVQTDLCTNTCQSARCGDGLVREDVEDCDDGDRDDGDECTNACTTARCGDGVVRVGVEECDDANDVNTDSCLAGCINARCGDGIIQEGVEACDDGNVITEECDYGLANCAVCAADCTEQPGETDVCGDGTVDLFSSRLLLAEGDARISDFGGTYARAVELSDGRIFATFDSGDDANFIIRSVESRGFGPWRPRASIAREPSIPDRTLGNGFPFEWSRDRVLVAFRHHDRVDGRFIYRLLLSAREGDDGPWRLASEIEVNDRGHGLWEPFLLRGADGHLQVYYAWEHAVGGKQDIVMRRSPDGGLTWGDRITVASHAQSRDGMPGVARLSDGTLLAVFESFRDEDGGPFVIRSVSSTDDGETWGNRRVVYAPEQDDRHAGAPSVITLADGRLVMAFMTDEDGPGGRWPDGASIKLLYSDGVPNREGVVWSPVVTASDAPSFWPGLTALSGGGALLLYEREGPRVRRIRLDGEGCDDGNTVTEECEYGLEQCTVCAADCTEQLGETNVCGDGTVDDGEGCDDGNTATEECAYGVDACIVCAADCTEQAGDTDVCGDGVNDAEEQCDDGGESDRCDADCTEARCGDGVLNPTAGEACDDGNDDDTDECTNACQVARCGDGVVQLGGAQCDGLNGAGLSLGDAYDFDEGFPTEPDPGQGGDVTHSGVIQAINGARQVFIAGADFDEVRCGPDDGRAYGFDIIGCDQADAGVMCIRTAEGNYIKYMITGLCGAENEGFIVLDWQRGDCGEACDDGNNITEVCDYGAEACTVCAADCTEQPGETSACGDGMVNGDEACDDGDDDNSDACTDVCELARCGDGYVQAGEACDGGDECGADCAFVDECAAELDDCSPDARCVDSGPGFTCECNAGFFSNDDGRTCEPLLHIAGYVTPDQCPDLPQLDGIRAWRDCNRDPFDPSCVRRGTPDREDMPDCEARAEQARVDCLAEEACDLGLEACAEKCDEKGDDAWAACVRPSGTWFNANLCNDAEIGTALQACRCLYGQGITHTSVVTQAPDDDAPPVSRTGCPIVSCHFNPCEGEPAANPLVACQDDDPVVADITDGYHWTVPDWAVEDPVASAGLFGRGPEQTGPNPVVRCNDEAPCFDGQPCVDGVCDGPAPVPTDAYVVDVSWRQLRPTADGPLDLDAVGAFRSDPEQPPTNKRSWREQTAGDKAYWVRMYTGHVTWAPEWVIERCSRPEHGGHPFTAAGENAYLPLWNPCVWGYLRDTYALLADQLRDNDRFIMMYVPGVYRYAEYGLGVIEYAAEQGRVTEAEYIDWFRTMTADLVTLFGDDAGKLVFTGEDHPYSIPDVGGAADANGPWSYEDISLLPRDAVLAGLGIRNGITENFDSHLNEVPAYGLTIQPNGHVAADENWVGYDGRVLGTENECFLAGECGLRNGVDRDDRAAHGRVVRLANLKALQMRMNWIYASGGSGLDRFRDHWHWVRHSLGRQRGDAFDGWAALRASHDRYFGRSFGRFTENGMVSWLRRPWVRNMERFVVQRDVCGDGVTMVGARRDGSLFHDDDLSFDGLRTDVARGQRSIYFDADAGFLRGDHRNIEVHVTFYQDAASDWTLEYQRGECTVQTAAVGGVAAGEAGLRTAVFRLPEVRFADAFDGSTDFAVRNRSEDDLRVEFVRVIRTEAATCGDGVVDAGEECDDGDTVVDRCAPGEVECTVCGDDCRETSGRPVPCDDGQIEWSDDLCVEVSACVGRHGCEQVCAEDDDGPICACDIGFAPDDDDECAPVCGDGFAMADEACDDGNDDNTDACTNACTPSRCGDGFVRRPDPRCGIPEAGAIPDGQGLDFDAPRGADRDDPEVDLVTGDADGVKGTSPGTVLLPANGAQLALVDVPYGALDCGPDDGRPYHVSTEFSCGGDGQARPFCLRTTAGDYYKVNHTCDEDHDVTYEKTDCRREGEPCDDGNDDNTDACTNVCELARCGDGFVQDDEVCDGGDDCTDQCTPVAVCGNAVVEPGEQCDDGNDIQVDGCTDRCEVAEAGGCAGVCDASGTAFGRRYAQLSHLRPINNFQRALYFGGSVAVDGERLAVGGRGQNGRVFLYERSAPGQWDPVVALTAADVNADSLGWKVALSGEQLLLGGGGLVRVFSPDDDGNWRLSQTIAGADYPLTSGAFGSVLTVRGPHAFIGDFVSDRRGAVYEFERNVDGRWQYISRISANDPNGARLFGERAIAFNGDVLMLGGLTDSRVSEGVVYVFERNVDGAWVRTQRIIAFPGASSNFGSAIAIDGDRAVIGSHFWRSSGRADLFVRNPDGQWQQATELAHSRPWEIEDGDYFGYDVAIDGDMIVIGAPGVYRNFTDDTGVAHVFVRDPATDEWSAGPILATEPLRFSKDLAWSVAIAGNEVLLGMPDHSDIIDFWGAVYSFSLRDAFCNDDGACVCIEGAAGELCDERPLCGDGVVQDAEQCDDGEANGAQSTCAYGDEACQVCSDGCMQVPGETSYCGDGVVDAENGEACDDGNDVNLDGCLNSCQLVVQAELSVGGFHNCRLFENGSARCVGLVAGEFEGPFVSLHSGTFNTCGRYADGSVLCWGEYDRVNGAQAGPFVDVTVGGFAACGLAADGSVTCWGNTDGFPPHDDYVEVSAGCLHVCGRRQDGTLSCWGRRNSGESTPPAGAFTQVTAGCLHACGLREDGTVTCWGHQDSVAPAGQFASVSSGGFITSRRGPTYHICGVLTSGNVDCWGIDNSGEAVDQQGDFIWVETGGIHTCGLEGNGQYRCWGDDGNDQLNTLD